MKLLKRIAVETAIGVAMGIVIGLTIRLAVAVVTIMLWITIGQICFPKTEKDSAADESGMWRARTCPFYKMLIARLD